MSANNLEQHIQDSKEYKYGFKTDIESDRIEKGLNEERKADVIEKSASRLCHISIRMGCGLFDFLKYEFVVYRL